VLRASDDRTATLLSRMLQAKVVFDEKREHQTLLITDEEPKGALTCFLVFAIFASIAFLAKSAVNVPEHPILFLFIGPISSAAIYIFSVLLFELHFCSETVTFDHRSRKVIRIMKRRNSTYRHERMIDEFTAIYAQELSDSLLGPSREARSMICLKSRQGDDRVMVLGTLVNSAAPAFIKQVSDYASYPIGR
jgi:hypothetical protein